MDTVRARAVVRAVVVRVWRTSLWLGIVFFQCVGWWLRKEDVRWFWKRKLDLPTKLTAYYWTGAIL